MHRTARISSPENNKTARPAGPVRLMMNPLMIFYRVVAAGKRQERDPVGAIKGWADAAGEQSKL
jgi:hypothetical protein